VAAKRGGDKKENQKKNRFLRRLAETEGIAYRVRGRESIKGGKLVRNLISSALGQEKKKKENQGRSEIFSLKPKSNILLIVSGEEG